MCNFQLSNIIQMYGQSNWTHQAESDWFKPQWLHCNIISLADRAWFTLLPLHLNSDLMEESYWILLYQVSGHQATTSQDRGCWQICYNCSLFVCFHYTPKETDGVEPHSYKSTLKQIWFFFFTTALTKSGMEDSSISMIHLHLWFRITFSSQCY